MEISGRRGRENRLFAKRKCRALLVYKQSYGCFEMVSPPRKQVIQKFISIAKNLNFTCSPFPTAKSIILSHPPPCGYKRSAGSARKRNETAKTLNFGRLFPQARTSRKQIDQQPNDVRTEFHGCSLWLKFFTVPFFNINKLNSTNAYHCLTPVFAKEYKFSP